MQLYSNGDAAKYFGVSRELLKHWVKTGQIRPLFTQSGIAIYTLEMLEEFRQQRSQLLQSPDRRWKKLAANRG